MLMFEFMLPMTSTDAPVFVIHEVLQSSEVSGEGLPQCEAIPMKTLHTRYLGSTNPWETLPQELREEPPNGHNVHSTYHQKLIATTLDNFNSHWPAETRTMR
ncbi:unnamed protein product [Ectocarpus sp. 4 AP-2014]